MGAAYRAFAAAGVVAALAIWGVQSTANAGGTPRGISVSDKESGLALNCENGGLYPIRAKAVSVEGELVTGYLVIAPRKHAYFRLIPMAEGYRYAGQGFWFDGLRGEATLKGKGKSDTIGCVVETG